MIDLEISYSLLMIFYDISELQTQKTFNRIDRIRTFHFKLSKRPGYQIILKLASLFTITICKIGCLNSKIFTKYRNTESAHIEPHS